MANETRAYAAAHFALELSGIDNLGVLRSIEGGGLKAEVMTYQNAGTENQKAWKACNFTFSIDGFECCKRATKIDSFTVKQTVLDYHAGGRRSASKTPSAIDFPQIAFYLPEADAQPLADHFKKRG